MFYFIIIICLILYSYIILPNTQKKILMKRFTIKIFPIIILGTMFIPILSFIREGFIEQWSIRLFGGNTYRDFDPTTITRISEYSGQMDLLFESIFTTLIGRGLGSVYLWDSQYFYLLKEVIPILKLEDHTPWQAGHSLWVYSLYSGGFLFGLIIPYCLIRTLIYSGSIVKKSFLLNESSELVEIIFFTLLVTSIIGASFTANPFGERLVGLLMGLGLITPQLLKLQLNKK